MASDKIGTTPFRTAGRHRGSSSFIPQCFKSSSVLLSDDDNDDVDHPATPSGLSASQRRKVSRFFSLPKIRDTKKTMPVDASAEPPETQTTRKSSLCRIGKDSNTKNNIRPQHHHRRQASAPSVVPAIPLSSTNTIIINSSLKSDSSTQPSPLHQLRESSRNETTTTLHLISCPKDTHSPTSTSSDRPSSSNKKSEAIASNRDAGLLVVAVTLTALLLLGRASAIVCMSVWFCLLPRPRAAAKQAALLSALKKDPPRLKDEIDTEEYKKRVVLQGLLERNKRKLLSRSATAPAGGIL